VLIHSVAVLKLLRRLESIRPIGLGVLVALCALVFVGARLALAADGDVTKFVVAGDSFVDRNAVDPPIHVFASSGYDGQFYWRMAVAPTDHRLESSHGVRLDQEIRLGRIGYPSLAWLGSLGRPSLVAWSLVLVNVLGLGVITLFAAGFARDRGLSSWWGLAVASSSGLAMSLARDLCEIVMIAGLVGAALAISRQRPYLAAAGFTVAVLTHEQSLVVILTYALWRLKSVVETRRLCVEDVAWFVPLSMFVCWQTVCAVAWGQAPVTQSGGKNLDLPFVGLARLLGRWIQGDLPVQHVLAPLQLLLMTAIVVVALRRTAADSADTWLRVSLALGTMMATCISYNVLKSPAEFRTMVIVPTLGFLAILASSERPPVWLLGSSVTVLIATIGLRVVAV